MKKRISVCYSGICNTPLLHSAIVIVVAAKKIFIQTNWYNQMYMRRELHMCLQKNDNGVLLYAIDIFLDNPLIRIYILAYM